jgi:hypothetical protein
MSSSSRQIKFCGPLDCRVSLRAVHSHGRKQVKRGVVGSQLIFKVDYPEHGRSERILVVAIDGYGHRASSA